MAALRDLVEGVIESQRHREEIQRYGAVGTELFGAQWQAERSDWTQLSHVTQWVGDLHRDIAAGQLPGEVTEFASRHPNRDMTGAAAALVRTRLVAHRESTRQVQGELALERIGRDHADRDSDNERFDVQEDTWRAWARIVGVLRTIIGVKEAVERCSAAGLSEISVLAETWPAANTQLVAALQRVWFESILERAYTERAVLAGFQRGPHELAIAHFVELDGSLFEYNRARLAYEHWQRLPRHEAGGGQLAILRREFEKKIRHLPLRQLMGKAGNAIQALKPVFMMSPLSIATFLPQGGITFDLIIFDEASQVKSVDALGAIARGKQVIVVGDSRQLPPTSFFDAMINVDDEENDEDVASNIESILGLFSAQGAPERMLRWHYRSRHESLIAFSNSEFYNHRLVVFPSPDASREQLGLIYHHLPDATYDRGRSRTNAKEAEAIAQAVMDHARRTPHLTLGVAAFSVAQMQAIQDRIEMLRHGDSSCEGFFIEHRHEPFFVKNLETLQGDERDIILISIGYGRSADGHLTMEFGPLNREGGERRLNVLITRARLRCEVFTNLTDDDIDLGRTQARGVRSLKAFLRYAQHGRLDMPEVTGREMNSPFEEQVAAALTAAGYAVRPQVGSAGFFIDLAIVDPDRPGRYLLGVECDGASYHSARSARDRDRLRQQILEGLGWTIHRIWSTDWYVDPRREIERVAEAVALARADTAVTSPQLAAANDEGVERDSAALPAVSLLALPPYQRATLRIITGGRELHEMARPELAAWIAQVVAVESPIHQSEVARRIAEATGIKRIGSRINEALALSCDLAVKRGLIQQRGEFLWATDMGEPPMRDRSALSVSSRKLELVAPEEVALTIKAAVAGAFGLGEDNVPGVVARLLGFGRLSDEMRKQIEEGVTTLVRNGQLTQQGSHLVVRDG